MTDTNEINVTAEPTVTETPANTLNVELHETTANAETPKPAEVTTSSDSKPAEIEKPKSNFVAPDDLVLEDVFTNPTMKQETTINELSEMIEKVFGRTKIVKEEKPAKLLKTDDQIDLRLAQLGIDNNFKMCKDDQGSVSYKSHVFNIKCNY